MKALIRRQRRTERCGVSLSADEFAALDALAERTRLPRSMVIRQMIRTQIVAHPEAVWFGAFAGPRLDLWVKACHQAEDEGLPRPHQAEQFVERADGAIVRIDVVTGG